MGVVGSSLPDRIVTESVTSPSFDERFAVGLDIGCGVDQ
jgi:hypothetical protein